MRQTLAWVSTFAIAAALAWTALWPGPSRDSAVGGPVGAPALFEARHALDETTWAKERLAQRYDVPITELWDDLRRAEDPFAVLGALQFEELRLGAPPADRLEDDGIVTTPIKQGGRTISGDEWLEMLEEFRARGYQLVESEWHQEGFVSDPNSPPRSTVAFVMHITRPDEQRTMIMRGTLRVDWSDRTDETGNPVPGAISVEAAEILDRIGPPAFVERLSLTAPSGAGSSYLEPLIVYDLDQNGFSDIILGRANQIHWNRGNWTFEQTTLLADLPKDEKGKPRPLKAAVVADFTGDGRPDLLGAGKGTQAVLYTLDEAGRFTKKRLVGEAVLPYPSSITAGDIDGDGDLDAWFAQYKPPYVQGQMPRPYYDANDGEPSYLWLNAGEGRFRDATRQAGLALKRHRRTYSSSFVDLDEDGDLDLLVVSDFAGVDVYLNNGKGRFTDATNRTVDEPANFGMAHTFGDYNLDGRLDFYVIGMSSTTARRLESMGLGRADHPDHDRMRSRMGYGNRLYLAKDDGSFAQPVYRDKLARSGWSWGTTSFDFDRDGDQDIYVANGHLSRSTARDYCTYFWTHDIYPVEARPADLKTVFSTTMQQLADEGGSWNGFEHNHLFLNDGGKGFRSVGFLMGVSFEFDSRAVVADDLDLDGRPDLLVVELETRAREQEQRLHVLQNTWEDPGHWIGVRLRDQAGHPVVGAKVTVLTSEGVQVARIVTGDSYSAQHANLKHFGLGPVSNVESITVEWPSGTKKTIPRPKVDRYHDIAPR